MLNYDKISSAVTGNSFVSRVYYFEETESTNDFAKKLKDNSDILVCTDFQKAGRGRFERKWESEKESNLTFTIRKTIPIAPSLNQYVNFFFSYYLFEAVHDILNENNFGELANDLNIKWPNDLLFKNYKIAGLLTESHPKSSRYVIGIGLNVNQEDFGSLENVSSLRRISGIKFDPTDILIRIVDKYSLNYGMLSDSKYDVIFEKWKRATRMIGKSCEFHDSEPEIKFGIISDLNSDGSIEILIDTEKMRFFSGDIKLTSF